MRSRPGSAPTSSANGRRGGGAQYASPLCGHVVAEERRALEGTHALDLDREILREERDTGERPVRCAVGSGVAGAVEHRSDDGIQDRVQPLDAFDRGLDELLRGQLTAANEIG